MSSNVEQSESDGLAQTPPLASPAFPNLAKAISESVAAYRKQLDLTKLSFDTSSLYQNLAQQIDRVGKTYSMSIAQRVENLWAQQFDMVKLLPNITEEMLRQQEVLLRESLGAIEKPEMPGVDRFLAPQAELIKSLAAQIANVNGDYAGKISKLLDDATNSVAEAQLNHAMEQWRVDFLGRKGRLAESMKLLTTLPRDERPASGLLANRVKDALEITYAVAEKQAEALALEQELVKGVIDVTLPGRPPALGRLHVTTQNLRQLYTIFAEMGFQVYDAPDVETDELNFGLLNIPPYHPARDMWDTFWVSQGEGGAGLSAATAAAAQAPRPAPTLVMRTHTSPGQIRVMRERCPEPIRVILPGKCYRYEQITARAEHQFYQLEGLAVGKGIRMTDLIGTLQQFARRMYGAGRRLRVRGSYFPFTEPSIEADMDCILCGGKGCGVCKYTGWLEIAGAGMVHPVVLRNGGYDPDVYSGFAWGMGVERPAMLKYTINDIRYFYGNDLRFLGQFG